ncbi:hydrogenase [Candidatus Kuenenbacteria bacterium HGW-Kuenenbacteria-1]|uniref:Hydrogenase n=1 Tax=Candidatus Kuenenbacteria bacterium HGW-Kuenenbacteria-1 TaxID=2013812 RepID=A0A2N1UPD6_9BACT|nr:MAG: hydrogenase [Candidatus Kuenenbacteria bacterium HGW-Kuenenbacteria-1]
MKNIYQSKTAIIKNIKTQTKEVKLFTLQFKKKKDQKDFFFTPGQFIEVGILGFGEAPFAICSSNVNVDFFQICVRKAGQLTIKLHSLKINDEIQIRGPYGNGFPKIENSTTNLLLIGGGIGLVPLRSIIKTIQDQKQNIKNKIILFYGVKDYNELLFKDEYKQWEKFLDLHIVLNKPDLKWKGDIGLITVLFDNVKLANGYLSLQAFLCGPPIMYKFVVQKLKELNIPDENIFLSLERRMHCGVGICQHCAIGSRYVCKNGPVFNYAEIKNSL